MLYRGCGTSVYQLMKTQKSGALFFLQMFDITQTNCCVWVSLMEMPINMEKEWSTGDAGHY
jgi:hypothetical protein